MPKPTVKDLLNLKGKRQLTEVFVDTPLEAQACEAAGIDMIVTSEFKDMKAIRAAAPNTFLTIGLIYGRHANADEAVRGGFNALGLGADAVYFGGSIASVEKMANEGIPVVGHVGLIPYKATWTGGFKAVGKTAEDALKVYKRTLAYQEAGAIAVEMEVVPNQIAAEISSRVKIIVLSMGSGTGCDGQYLFVNDILGTNAGHVPRHAKVYANLRAEYERLHLESIAALSAFRAEVETGVYPAMEHMVTAKDDEYQKFLWALETVPETLGLKEFL
jgi:3-methyl-2-oxobutanoate hydroxymethyltransferase